MDVNEDIGSRITFRIDGPDFLDGFEITVAVGNWRAMVHIDTTENDLQVRLYELERWNAKHLGKYCFDVGSEDHAFVRLEFMITDRSGHVGCRIRMSNEPQQKWEGPWKAELAMRTEPQWIQRFIMEFHAMLNGGDCDAVLEGVVA